MNPSGETSLSLQYKLIFLSSFCIIITIVYDNEDCNVLNFGQLIQIKIIYINTLSTIANTNYAKIIKP